MKVRSFAFDPAGAEPVGPAFPRPAGAPEPGVARGPGLRQRHFVVLRDSEPIGRVSAFRDPRLRDPKGRAVGTVGRFACVEEYGAAEALLASAVGWLRRAGAARVWGPIDADLWSAYRFKRRGFELGTFLGEPDNPSHHPRFFERFGFRVLKTWCSLEITGRGVLAGLIAGSRPRRAGAIREGYRFRRCQTGEEADLRALHGLLARSYGGFLGFTPIGYADFRRCFAAVLRSIDSRFVTLVHDPRGTPAGFAILYPDPADPGAPGRGPGTEAARRVVFHSLGVTPEESARRHGLGRALVAYSVQRVLDAGHERVVAALVAEDSPVHRIVGPLLERADREYALYELAT